MLKPRFGAPPDWITLPFWISCRLPETSPTACLTPGSASTRGSSVCENGGTSAPLPPAPPVALESIAFFPVTVAAVLL